MNCPHCEATRTQQREIMDRFGVDHLPRWGERGDIDAALRLLAGSACRRLSLRLSRTRSSGGHAPESRAARRMSRPMWEPPRWWRLFTRDAVVTGVAVAAGLFVALFILGFIAP